MKFTRDLIIRFEHCDAAGIIFYPRFFGLVNETVEDWFASLGHIGLELVQLCQRLLVLTLGPGQASQTPASDKRLGRLVML